MKRLGFTFIELLVGISIVTIVSTLGLASYIDFNRRQVVDQAAKTVVSDLRLAQSLATNQEKPSGCNDFQGYVFNRGSTTTYTINSICTIGSTEYKSVTMSDVVFSGLTAVNFKILSKDTEFVGGNTLTITGKAGYAKTLTVGISGDININ